MQNIILFKAVKKIEFLKSYENQDKNFLPEEWEIFRQSDQYKILYQNLYKKDEKYLKKCLEKLSGEEYRKSLF